jgi:hypothetical protein
MRFLKHLQRRWFDWNARIWGKECARVMLFAFLVKKNQYESTAPTYAWVARQAMLTRPHWVQVGETAMQYDRSGQTIDVPDDSNLKYAIHAVIEIEYSYELSKMMSSWECFDMLRLAHDAADKFLAQKSGR